MINEDSSEGEVREGVTRRDKGGSRGRKDKYIHFKDAEEEKKNEWIRKVIKSTKYGKKNEEMKRTKRRNAMDDKRKL